MERRVHTIDDGTDNLMNLAILGRLSRGESLGDGRSESLRLEGALVGGSAESRGAQRPGDAAIKRCQYTSGTQWRMSAMEDDELR